MRKFQGLRSFLRFGLALACLLLYLSLEADPPGTLTFYSPSLENAGYRIRFPLVVDGGTLWIKSLELNGADPGPFLVFKGRKNIASSAPLEDGSYMIILDYAWTSGKPYRARLVCRRDNGEKSMALDFIGTAPQKGGIPGGREGFYRVFLVEEEAGLARVQEVVTFTLTAPKKDLNPPDIVVFDGNKMAAFEIMEKMDSVPPEAVAANHPVTSTLKIALPLDALAYEKKMLLVLKGDQSPVPRPGFSVSGEGLGKTITGSKLCLALHPQSGQVNTIESLESGIRLFNKAGVIHWNPDVFVPGVGWDHSFDWNPPPTVEEKAGSYVYISSRRGHLPRIGGVTLDVKYRLEADAPYFISETQLVFNEGQGVIAVRNDEMVLFHELFDSLIYKDKRGEIVKLPLQEKPGAPFGLVHVAPEDLGWVGLVNGREGFGFFSLRLYEACGNFGTLGEFQHKAGTYFYAPKDGNYVYWVRPLIYTWADYFTNNLFAFVPKGSFFYEKNAYIVMRLHDGLSADLDNLRKRLRHPLRVY